MSKVLDYGLAISGVPDEVIEITACIWPIASSIHPLIANISWLIVHYILYVAACSHAVGTTTHILLDQSRQVFVIHNYLRHIIIKFRKLALTLMEISTKLHSSLNWILFLLIDLVLIDIAPHLLSFINILILHIIFDVNSLVREFIKRFLIVHQWSLLCERWSVFVKLGRIHPCIKGIVLIHCTMLVHIGFHSSLRITFLNLIEI